MINIKLMTIIMDEGTDKKVNFLLNGFGIKMKTVIKANGTATPSILDYFGLTETKKDLVIAITPESMTKKIFSGLEKLFKIHESGKGIAFTVPISSSNKFLSDQFNSKLFERSKKNMTQKSKSYHLILTILSEGHIEEVMNVTKKMGVQGGTVIKGRELSNIIPKKILGFNVEEEKEIILNIVEEKNKNKIMQEISKTVGIKTAAEGICFSIPVEDSIGLNIEQQDNN